MPFSSSFCNTTHKSVLSDALNGKGPLSVELVHSIIQVLAEQQAIRGQAQVYELLELTDCEDFSPADWNSPPLADLAQPKTTPIVPGRLVSQQDSLSFDESAARAKYLERICNQYGLVVLPIGKDNNLALQAIFQPLRLRQDPLAAEDLVHEDRRALLDEPTREEYDPRHASPGDRGAERERQAPPIVIASNGEEALEKSPQRRMIVLGSPGAGKTTILKDLISRAAQRAQNDATALLPIFISLPDLAETSQSFQRYLPVMLGRLGIDDRYAEVLWREIQTGRAFICLDSLDEVPAERRRSIIDWSNVLASDPGNIWIIGSRFSEYKGGQFKRGRFSEWELQPLTHQLRHELAERLLPELHKHIHESTEIDGRTPTSFVSALEGHIQASTWGKNPLLFSLAAVAFVRSGVLPSSRTALHQQVIDAILETRQKSSLRKAVLHRVVSSLALELHKEKRRTFTQDTLLRFLAEIRLRHKENWGTMEMAQRIINSGLLEVVARGTYGFWHLTFQEYLAAADLAHCLVDPDTKLQERFLDLSWRKRTYSRWVEVLRLMVGILVQEFKEEGTQRALGWLHRLLAQRAEQEGDVGDLGLALVIQSLSEVDGTTSQRKDEEWIKLEEAVTRNWIVAFFDAANRKHESRQERLLLSVHEICQFNSSVAQMAKEALTTDFRHKNAPIRKAVVRALGKLGKYAPVDLLMYALGDKHSEVREVAAHALAELEEHVPVDMLVKALRNERTVVREAATQALGEIRQPSLLNNLLPGLEDVEWSVRAATVKALGNLGEHAPIDQLIKMLHDKDSSVRLTTIEALGTLGERIYDWLIPLLDDPDDLIRAEVIKTLGQHTPIKKLIEEITRPRMMVSYSSAYRNAVQIIGELEEQEILNAIEKIENNGGQELRMLIQSLWESQQAASTEDLVKYLSNFGNHKQMCLSAAHGLVLRNEWTPIKHFLTSLESGHGFVRAIAVRLLGRLEENIPSNILTSVLTDKDAAVRLAALKALEDLKGHPLADPISVVELLKDRDREIRTSALRVLGQVSQLTEVNASLLETLFALANDRYEPVQNAAKLCLEKLGEKVTSNLIDTLFKHEDVSLRIASIKTLGKHASLRQLITALQVHEARVRAEVIHVLGQRREQSAIGLLVAALNDENIEVHRAAIQALERLGHTEILAEYAAKKELIPLRVTMHFDLRNSMEWRVLAERCDAEEILDLQETEILPLEYFREYDDRMTRFHELLGEHGNLIAIKTRVSAEQELVNPSSAILSRMLERLYRNASTILRKRASIDQLIDALNHENGDVRRIALEILGERTPEDELIAALDDEDCQVRREALRILGDSTPMESLVIALDDEYDIVREVALDILKKWREQVPEDQLITAMESRNGAMRASAIQVLRGYMPVEKFLAALGDSEEEVRLAAADVLRQDYPEALRDIVLDLTVVLMGKGSSEILASAANSFIVEIIEYMESVPSFLMEILTDLLDWSYWEVRTKSAQALGKVRRNIPEEAIRRLQKLRNDDESETVRRAADDALAEILSLETGIEG